MIWSQCHILWRGKLSLLGRLMVPKARVQDTGIFGAQELAESMIKISNQVYQGLGVLYPVKVWIILLSMALNYFIMQLNVSDTTIIDTKILC